MNAEATQELDGLVAWLREVFQDGPQAAPGKEIAARLAAYATTHEDWRAFANFSDERYTRNLVVRDTHFELLVLCWGAAQESPIHNHEGQDCWMAVLEGEIEELRYCCPEDVRPGPLEPHGARSFTAGSVAFIKDEIGLHLVRSAHAERTGVSLHLYAAPYDYCDVYCPDTGQITRKRLQNDYENGRPVARESSAD